MPQRKEVEVEAEFLSPLLMYLFLSVIFVCYSSVNEAQISQGDNKVTQGSYSCHFKGTLKVLAVSGTINLSKIGGLWGKKLEIILYTRNYAVKIQCFIIKFEQNKQS